MNRLPPRAARLILGVCLGAAFLVMASIIVPDASRAEPRDPAASDSTDPHAGLASLGSLEDDRYVVQIYGGRDGPLYSVYDAHDGRELAVLLTAEKAATWFPDLPIPDMDFGTGTALMLAMPEDMD